MLEDKLKNSPVGDIIEPLKKTLRSNQICLLSAPPGAGKTTLVPPSLLHEPYMNGKKIILLEPRRLAALACANYIAKLLNEKCGQTVGYIMRMERCISSQTRLIVMTEGVLTAMLQNDPELADVGCIIFDEFHERNLNSDIAFTFSWDIAHSLRPDLKLLIMSATMDTDELANRLNCPLINSKGRSFEVETLYHSSMVELRNLARAAAEKINFVAKKHRKSILVFLPGEREIMECAKLIRQMTSLDDDTDLFLLHGKLSLQEQSQAIAPSLPDRRKIVLATPIAESSLTIDGIECVIDGGFARTAVFSPSTNLSGLETTRISLASANQRRGRAGRIAPGFCYRLWPAEFELQMSLFTPEEIKSADLSMLLLQLKAWGVKNPQELFWLTPPPEAACHSAELLLQKLEALDCDGNLTLHGKAMLKLNLHPRLSHMLLKSEQYHCQYLGCLIAAILSEYDLRTNTEIDLETLIIEVLNSSKLKRIKTFADHLAERLKIKPTSSVDTQLCAVLLAHAYFDRIAQQRENNLQGYLLSNGRGGRFQYPHLLCHQRYLVAAVLSDNTQDAIIRLGAAISVEQIEKYLSHLISKECEIINNQDKGSIKFVEQTKLGALCLKSQPQLNPPRQDQIKACLDFIRRHQWECVPESENSKKWRQKIAFLRQNDQTFPWPDLSDERLLDLLEEFLIPFVPERLNQNFLSQIDFFAAIKTLVPYELQHQINLYAPDTFTVPTNSKIKIDYSQNPPVLAVRIQELFGQKQHPCILNNRFPLTLHLLSPARRPVQITSDLPGFWNNSYALVRKELRGRYPKHYWPEDPANSEPTTRTKNFIQ